jgi:hypothetical protein
VGAGVGGEGVGGKARVEEGDRGVGGRQRRGLSGGLNLGVGGQEGTIELRHHPADATFSYKTKFGKTV